MNSLRLFSVLACVSALALAACDARATEHAFTARVLRDAHAEHEFTDVSTAAGPAIRHNESGMLCAMPAGGAVHVEVFPADASNPGAECTFAAGDVVTTLLAVRFRERPALDAAFAESVSANAQLEGASRWPGAASAPDRAPVQGSPHFRIMRLQGSFQGNMAYMRMAMAEANGWYVQQIVLTPLGNAEAIEAAAGAQWRELLVSMSSQNRSPHP